MAKIAFPSIVTSTTVHGPSTLEVDDGVVVSIRPGVDGDAQFVDGTALPGFVDIHCHGGGGVSFGQGPADRAIAWHRSQGTTTTIASLVTDTTENLKDQVSSLATAVAKGQVAGIHLEGPWLSPDRHGAHGRSLLQPPSRELLAALWESSRGGIRMITIAPELPGALDVITDMVGLDIIPALGHTACSGEMARQALDQGAQVVTHLFNAMPHLRHRDSSLVDVALLDSRPYVELILDGIHVAPHAALLALKLAGERIVCITDALAAAGMPDGEYRSGALDVDVRGGIARVRDSGVIAGSTISMLNNFNFLVKTLGSDLPTAVAATSTRPAQALRLRQTGDLAVGFSADIAVWDGTSVTHVLRRGVWLE